VPLKNMRVSMIAPRERSERHHDPVWIAGSRDRRTTEFLDRAAFLSPRPTLPECRLQGSAR
jgi:hypothetical protein